MTHKKVDLAEIFDGVTRSLIEDQQTINQADQVNHSHGDHMVQTFQTITHALEQKKDRPDSEALAYASRQVAKTATSDSARLYAQNLQQASVQFKGKQVDEKGALELLQTLIGGGQAAPSQQPQQTGSDDLLGSLLGGLGGGNAPAQQPQQSGSDDLLGSLLDGLAGGDSSPKPSQPTQQADTSDLLGSLLSGMGGGEASQQPSGGSDLFGALLGGMGGGSDSTQQASQAGGSDLMSALLGGLGGGGASQGGGGGQGGGGSQGGGASQGGFNWQKLLAAGMAYLQAKQQGGSTPQALVQAFMSYSGMGRSPQRTASTEVVVDSYLRQLNAS